MTNIHYIRSAIYENTKQWLPLEEVLELLLEEQMLTHKDAQRLLMKDYGEYYSPKYDDYEVEHLFEEDEEEPVEEDAN